MNRAPVTPSPAKRSPGGGTRSTGGSRRRPNQPSSVEREQALRDYKLTLEYKHLKQHCPGGVYLIPSHDDLRLFHGVIFVRRGAFTNGIFKFTLQCPPKYNDVGTHPTVTFSSYVYNPHVHPESGEVDIKLAFPRWDNGRHFLATVLTYVKRIFYIKDPAEEEKEWKGREKLFPNQEAWRLFNTDQEAYRRRVQECVRESQRGVFLNDPGCTIRFSEDEKCHEIFRSIMKQRFGGNKEKASADDISRAVTREGILEAVVKAHSRSMEEEE